MKINDKRKLAFLREKETIYKSKIKSLSAQIADLVDNLNINSITEENKIQYANLERQRQLANNLLINTTEQLTTIYSKLN